MAFQTALLLFTLPPPPSVFTSPLSLLMKCFVQTSSSGEVSWLVPCISVLCAWMEVWLWLPWWTCGGDGFGAYNICINWLHLDFSYLFLLLLGIFFIYISNAIPKVPQTIPPTHPTTHTSWPWCSPILRHIKFSRPRGLSSQWGLTRPSSDICTARDMSSGRTG